MRKRKGSALKNVRRKKNVYYKPKYSFKRDLRTTGGNTVAITRSWVMDNIGIKQSFPYGYAFKLSDLPNYTELTGLFDCYKITGVKLFFIPCHNSREMGELTYAPQIPQVHYCFDPDNNSPPASLNAVLERQGSRSKSLAYPFSVYLTPTTTSSVYATGVTSAYKLNSKSAWIDSDNANVEYYGFKMWIEGATTQNFYFNLKIVAKYYVKLKWAN